MKNVPNFQEIANAAGYVAYMNVNGSYEYWHWRNEAGPEMSLFPYGSKEKAYEVCCAVNNLVK